MKKLLLLLLLVLGLVQSGWSQQKPGAFVGLQHQLGLQHSTYRLSLAPMAGIRYQRHGFSAGPVLLLKDYSAATRNSPQLTGLQLSYQYILSASEEKKLRLYTEVISKGQLFTEEWNSNYWDEARQQYVDATQESREWLIENYAGIGLRYQVLPRLYAQTGAMLGYSFSEQQRKGDSPNSADNSLDYRSYKKQGLCYALNLGVYYRLGK